MAYQALAYDVVAGSLDFGVVDIGQSGSAVIRFTNTTTPSIAIAVTINPVPTGFVLGAGDSAFNLDNNGDSRDVELTFSPGSYGGYDFTLSVAHDAPNPASPILIPVTGECAVPWTLYALADVENNAGGVMKVSLVLPSSVAAPTLPFGNHIMSIGPLVERIDVEPGLVDVENLELELAEDYSTYPEGFWYHVLMEDPTRRVQFRFILEEDGVDTFFFWGEVYRDEIQWPEHYVAADDSAVVRTVRVSVVSLTRAIQATSISTLITELLAHESAVAGFWTLESVLASIVAVGFQQTYATTNVIVRSTDIRFTKDDGLTVVEAMDTYIRGAHDPAAGIPRGYFDCPASDDNPYHWETRYANVFELLRVLCLNFGWTCRHFYGQADGSFAGDATDKHRLEFLTRGNSYANTITPEKGIEESLLYSATEKKQATVKVGDVLPATIPDVGLSVIDRSMQYAYRTGSKEVWYYLFGIRILVPTADMSIPDPPPGAEFDIDFLTEFQIDFVPAAPGFSIYQYRSLFYNDGGTMKTCLFAQFYDWQAGDWAANWDSIQAALMLYYSRRFGPGQKAFERGYGSMKFTDGAVTSHRSLKPMKRTSISDLITTDIYYATEVTKDFESNSSQVLWLQEE